MNKPMTVCEMVGCSFVAQGECSFFGSECPNPNKAVADGLVGALTQARTVLGTLNPADDLFPEIERQFVKMMAKIDDSLSRIEGSKG